MASLLEVRGVTKDLEGLTILRDVGFSQKQGEILGLIGPNGAGKTTLFNVISGVYRPDRGSIRFDGSEIAAMKPHTICRMGIGRTFQIAMPFPKLTVFENALIGSLSRFRNPVEGGRRAGEALQKVGLYLKKDQLAQDLTTPELKRLELGRALSTGPRLLLLDEIMSGLRPPEQKEIIELLCDLRTQGISLLVIEHVMKAVMTLSDRIIVLHHGEKIAEGGPDAICRDPRVIQAYLGDGNAFARSQPPESVLRKGPGSPGSHIPGR